MEIEEAKGRPLTDIIGEFSMRNIVLLISKGLGKSEDDAIVKIEEYFTSGKDMVELYLSIMESLQKSGFLPKALKINELRAKMQKRIETL